MRNGKLNAQMHVRSLKFQLSLFSLQDNNFAFSQLYASALPLPAFHPCTSSDDELYSSNSFLAQPCPIVKTSL